MEGSIVKRSIGQKMLNIIAQNILLKSLVITILYLNPLCMAKQEGYYFFYENFEDQMCMFTVKEMKDMRIKSFFEWIRKTKMHGNYTFEHFTLNENYNEFKM